MGTVRTYSSLEKKMIDGAFAKVRALAEKRRAEGWEEDYSEQCHDPKFVREELGLSQREFHLLFGFSTVNWEHGRRAIKPYMRFFLYLIYLDPVRVATICKQENENESDPVEVLKSIIANPLANAVLTALTRF